MSRILVVEDNRMNRELIHAILTHGGHTVVEGASAEEGSRLILAGPYDLVLMDIQLPGGRGEALLAEIGADARYHGVKVAAVTAQAMRGDRERLLAAGFDAYVEKPIDTRAFAAVVAALLERKGAT